MEKLKGFWSYVHDDDKAEKGRIAQLAHDLVEQYSLITGENIDLFLDKDNIKWGDKWKEKIDRDLTSTIFFMPIITPRYLLSTECVREMQYFLSKATSIGVRELVLALLYVDIPQLNDEKNQDALINTIRGFQYEDWREIRFSNTNSEQYRIAVYRLAKRLVEINSKIEQNNDGHSEILETALPEKNEDDDAGLIDKLAEMEKTMPEWNSTLLELTKEIENVGTIAREETEYMSSKENGTNFLERLDMIRKLANRLSVPAEKIWQLSNKNMAQVNAVEIGLCSLFENASEQIKTNPQEKENVESFLTSFRGLISAGKDSFNGIDSMISSLGPVEKLSREIRPVIRKIKEGLTRFYQTKDSFNEWEKILKKYEESE